MCDYRERLLSTVNEMLLDEGFTPDQVRIIKTCFVMSIENYELSPRSTELVAIDESNDKMIKIYLGSILTEGKSQKTAKEYQRLLKRFISDVGKNFYEITTFDIRIWLANEQKRVELITVENERSYLSAFYSWLAAEEIIQTNPMARIKTIKYAEPIKTEFSDVEIDAMRSVSMTLRERAEFELMLSSGVRVEELTDLKRSDINLNTMEVVVRDGKGSKSRITYMNDVCKHHLSKYLDDRKDDIDILFLSRSASRLTEKSVYNDMKRVAKKSNVINVHPHRFRRTFATTMHRRGMDLPTIQKLMGHSNPQTTMRYISMSASGIKNAYEKCN